MESQLGRYFEGRRLELTRLLKQVYDLASGLGQDVSPWIDGRELVFGRGPPRQGRGFLRVIPGEVQLVLAFPRGHELFDPKRRARGPRRSETQLTISQPIELDAHVRRMIDAAYALDG